jgi:nucleoid-associated protein YgaU
MDRFDELKTKYASVLELVQTDGVSLSHLHVQDDKLVMTGAAPNQDIVNAIWNQIKAVDATYSDLAAEITVDSSLPQPTPPTPEVQKYTVVAGDSLSKISKHFYGDPNHYMKIFQANQDQLSDPNVIQIGQELVIPPAE